MSANSRLRIVVLLVVMGSMAHGQSPRVVTALRANGTYRHRGSEIRILALGHNKLRVQLDLIYEYKSQYGQMANIGSTIGEAMITNDTAIFHPPESQKCTITIKFLAGNRIKVTQDSDSAECGFGNHVFADGTYVKVKGGKPQFEPDR
ncbi:MAG: hypothetical protein M3R68_08525 [Acidobacteriota bacterium]|nr:hypothetical protein [Acidobacteriota bacterium]